MAKPKRKRSETCIVVGGPLDGLPVMLGLKRAGCTIPAKAGIALRDVRLVRDGGRDRQGRPTLVERRETVPCTH